MIQKVIEVTKELALSIVAKCIIEDGVNECECVMCSTFGDYPDNIKHTSSCPYLIAEKFILEYGD